jgi:hypothetical protein
MNYTSLIADKDTAGSIKRWVNHATLDSVQVLEEAQALIFQNLRIRQMRAEFDDLSLSSGDSYIALPTGFLDPIVLTDVTNGWQLDLRDEADLQAQRIYDTAVLVESLPRYYAIFQERLQFECKYESAATLKLIGFKTPTLLSGSNTTNFLTDRYPHVLRVACMAMAYNFRNEDEREAKELQKLAAFIQKTNAESDLSYRGRSVSNEVW